MPTGYQALSEKQKQTLRPNRADVIETVSLAREGSDWKVVGIYVD